MPGRASAEAARLPRPAGRAGGWLAAAVVLGLVLRLLFGLVYWVDKPLTLDEQEYLLLGRSLASGQGFTYPKVAGETARATHFGRPPAYPAFVAATLVLTRHPWAARPADPASVVPLPRSSSDVPRAVLVLQSLVGALGVWLIGLIAWRAAGPRAAVIAAVLAAVEPPLLWTCGYALNETLYSTLALAGACLLVRASAAGARTPLRIALLAGVVSGLAVLTREGMVFFLPLVCLWLVARRRVALPAVFLAGVAVAVLPWVARNYAVDNRLELTTAHGGVTFWTGNNPLARGEGDMAANPEMKRARAAIEASHAGTGARDMDAVYYGLALDFIRRDPLAFAGLEARKLFYTLVPVGPSYLLHSPRYRVASWLSYGLLLPLAIVGLVRLGRRADVLWPVLLLAASVVLMDLVFFPQERFRIPVIDPVLVVCTAACAAPRRAATEASALS